MCLSEKEGGRGFQASCNSIFVNGTTQGMKTILIVLACLFAENRISDGRTIDHVDAEVFRLWIISQERPVLVYQIARAFSPSTAFSVRERRVEPDWAVCFFSDGMPLQYTTGRNSRAFVWLLNKLLMRSDGDSTAHIVPLHFRKNAARPSICKHFFFLPRYRIYSSEHIHIDKMAA